MILISSISSDYSTNIVIDWLCFYNVKCLRLNENSKILNLNIFTENSLVNILLSTNDTKNISLNRFNSFWYRRGRFNFSEFVKNKNIAHHEIKRGVYSHLINEEAKTIEEFIVSQLESKNKIGSYYKGNANKLKSLLYARKVGLKTPKSIVSSSKTNVLKFYECNDKSITKGVQDIMSFVSEENSYAYKTELVNKEDIEEMNDSFFPSLLQENIEKLYELRVFYLDGEFYSMAIFSQQDEQTKVDFRDYNWEKPNRNVPYKLPQEVEDKLHKFMQLMELNTGSIDIIVTPELEYVFLEVNPVGQYGMTSFPCNYHLDEKIAQYLSN